MAKFGVVGEGPTDQVVIESIIHGYFSDSGDAPIINHLQPPRPLNGSASGWGHVLRWLKLGRYVGALQYLDYLVIHIDSDVQEESEFNVPRMEAGKLLEVPQLVERIIERLKSEVDASYLQANSHRLLFAVAVNSIECWLLPLLHDDKKAAKDSGCEEAANRELRRSNRRPLSSGGKASFESYQILSREYEKRRTLMQRGSRSPSLKLFVDQLARLQDVEVVASPSASAERETSKLPSDEVS